jgi:hypothetical protein
VAWQIVNLTERQAGRADGLLKFRFAKENKGQSFSAKRSLSSPTPQSLRRGQLYSVSPSSLPGRAKAQRRRPVERATDFSYQISKLPVSSAFKSDRLLGYGREL